MADVIYKRGLSSRLNDVNIQDGQILVTTDTGNMYVDVDEGTRKLIGSGEKNISQGEIFNDYANNIAGSKAFTVQAIAYTEQENGSGEGIIVLDSTEGLEIKDEFSIHLAQGDSSSLQCDNAGIITNINKEENTVTVSPLFNNSTFKASMFEIWDSYLDENGDDTEVNTFRIPNKPNVGTRNIGCYASAKNKNTKALSKGSSAEGKSSVAAGSWSHAEGSGTYAAYSAHSEGSGTKALGQNSHAEGQNTQATSFGSHAEGYLTESTSNATHSEGRKTKATAPYAHSEGNETIASGESSHTEGYNTKAANKGAHAEGISTNAVGTASHTEGNNTTADGFYTHAEGSTTKALGRSDHAEGDSTLANSQFPEGATQWTVGAHAEGCQTKALHLGAHAEGYVTAAFGTRSHAEGEKTNAGGQASHAEGWGGNALPYTDYTLPTDETILTDWITKKFLLAKGQGSHAEGNSTLAIGNFSHTEGKNTVALGEASHAGGYETVSKYNYQKVIGMFNNNKQDTLFEVGNGTSNNSGRSNALEVYKDGHAEIQIQGNTDNSVVIKKTLENAISQISANTAEIKDGVLYLKHSIVE